MDFNEDVRSISIDPLRPNVVYAGSVRSGIYLSEDGGGIWKQHNDGLTTRAVLDLAIASDGETLYATTDGGGVFRLSTLTQGDFNALNVSEPTPTSTAIATAEETDEPVTQETEIPEVVTETGSEEPGSTGLCGSAVLPVGSMILLAAIPKFSMRKRDK